MRKFIEEIVNKIIKQDYFGVAAEMAFWFILALFPFLLFLTTLFARLGRKTLMTPILDFIADIAPPDVAHLIIRTLNEAMIFKQGLTVAIFGLCITIFLSSNAIVVIMKGLNRAYAIEETRNFIYTRTIAIIMVFINALVLFLTVSLIVFGRVLLDFALEYTLLSKLSVNVISFVRWPVSYLALFFVAFINYYVLPALEGDEKIKFKSVIYGTCFFCLFWMAGSWGFGVYLGHLNAYNKVYGAIGAVCILMVWLYYTSLIVLIAGEINSRAYNRLLKKKREQAVAETASAQADSSENPANRLTML